MYASWSAVDHALHNRHVENEYGIDLYGDHREELSQYSVDTIERGEEYLAIDYKLADVHDGLADIFEEYDILLSPTVGRGPETIDGKSIPTSGWHLTLPYNFSGHPAASIPAGFVDDNLLVGLQTAGRQLADDDMLAASAAIERLESCGVELPMR